MIKLKKVISFVVLSLSFIVVEASNDVELSPEKKKRQQYFGLVNSLRPTLRGAELATIMYMDDFNECTWNRPFTPVEEVAVTSMTEKINNLKKSIKELEDEIKKQRSENIIPDSD